MPIEPTVFQPIRSNDVQHRPIKAYKNYALRNASATTESGHFIHNGVYKKVTPHIDPITGQGVGTRVYPVNAGDSTNEHVVWNTIDARYYRKPTPDSSFDFTDIEKQHNFLSYSASILTMPYFQVGEKIKPFSGHLTTEGSPSEYDLFDDGEGNLIISASDGLNFTSSVKLGDVIYPHGLVLITSESLTNLINEDLDISWKASHPIYTYNIRCKVKDYEMNFTQNPSSIKSSDGILKDNVTGSSFNPYVTTVGLYNDSNELLAVAKLGQPLPKSEDTDMTFVIKLDM